MLSVEVVLPCWDRSPATAVAALVAPLFKAMSSTFTGNIFCKQRNGRWVQRAAVLPFTFMCAQRRNCSPVYSQQRIAVVTKSFVV